MSEAKFTPGPWHISKAPTKGWPITRTGDYFISSAPMRGEHYGAELADLNLIAAAPDMYEALKAVNRYRHLENGIADLFFIVVSNDDGKQLCVGDLIDAALAKARGEAQ